MIELAISSAGAEGDRALADGRLMAKLYYRGMAEEKRLGESLTDQGGQQENSNGMDV